MSTHRVQTTIQRSGRSLIRPLVASIAALITVNAHATIFDWINTGNDWGTAGDWTPTGIPTATDTVYFSPQFGSGTAIDNPDIEGSQSAAALNIANSFLGGTYAFTGSGTLTLGGAVTVRGFGTQVMNGPALAGAAAGNLTFNVGTDSGLTLTGATTATTNAGTVTLNGGTLTLDNTSTTTLHLGSSSGIALNSGTLSILGNSSGTSYSLGTLLTGSGFPAEGFDTVSVTVPNGATAGTTVNFSNAAGSLRATTGFVINFVGVGGALGTVGGPQITFTGAPTTSTAAAGGNGNLLANSATGATAGFAIVTDTNGTTWATYGANGIMAVTPSNTATTATDLAGLAATNVSQLNIAAGATVTATSTILSAAFRITPGGAGSTLDLATNGVSLQTNALMVTGSNNFTITGTSASLLGTSSSGTKYVYVTNPSTTLSTGIVFGGTNPVNFVGPGFVVLTGNYAQNTVTSTNRFNLLGGVLRGNSQQLGNITSSATASVIGFRGGVLEITGGTNGTGASADFTRVISNTNAAGSTNWASSTSGDSVGGSGGFSAFGAPASVNIGGAATPQTLTWGVASSGFVQDGMALLFGSTQSNNNITFYNPLALDAGSTTAGTYAAREIKVTQGAGTAVDKTTLAGVISGSATTDLLKTGTGVLELNQANTYAGNTLVQGGTLLVTNSSGSATGTGNVLVENGAKVAGTGIMSGTVTLQLGGKLAPGALLSTTPATLSASGLVWNAGATLVFDLVAGNSSDALALNGALTRGVNGVFAFDFDGGGVAGQTYNLITFTSTTFSSASAFSATDLAAGVAGTFQFGGAGNDTLQFVTTAVAAPEPSSVLAMVSGVTMLGLFGRFRRRFC